MWGNRLGWTISAVILLAYIAGFGWLVRGMNTASAATAFVNEAPATSPLALPVSPVSALPSMTDPADAATLLRQAIDHYRRNQQAYDRFLTSPPGSAAGLPPSDVRGVDLLVQATPMSTSTLFAQQPESIVGYGPRADLEALSKLGDAAVRLGLLRQNGDAGQKQQAVKYYEAAFSLGAKLVSERVTYAELMQGLRLMGDSAVHLAKLARAAGDTKRAQAFANFNAGRQSFYRASVEPMARVLNSIDSRVIQDHAGDVIYLAQKAPERVWRVEAILAMGRMRFFVGENGRAGDQRVADRVLKMLVQDSDPVIRTAAQAASALTIEEYRTLWWTA
jgi:hypothetical protein